MATVFSLMLLWLTCSLAVAQDSPFDQALPGRVLSFPRDHGKHEGFQTEWWYFTGNLEGPTGERLGLQLTFFRRTMIRNPPRRASAWTMRDLYLGHYALADLTRKTFFRTEVVSREGPGLAGASSDDLNVRIRNWTAERTGDSFRIRAQDKDHSVDLTLVAEKAPVLHGDKGFSRKGDSGDQASYYYSYSRLAATGTITVAGNPVLVQGLVWMDHEFGSSILTPHQAGWDWFGLQLDDGTEVMAFTLRKTDGSFEKPFATFVDKDGSAHTLSGESISITRNGTSWKSPRSGAVYPAGWTLAIPAKALEINVTPSLADQELSTEKSTRITYWEGSVRVEGSSQGRPVRGWGFVELTGYAHSMGGRL